MSQEADLHLVTMNVENVTLMPQQQKRGIKIESGTSLLPPVNCKKGWETEGAHGHLVCTITTKGTGSADSEKAKSQFSLIVVILFLLGIIWDENSNCTARPEKSLS